MKIVLGDDDYLLSKNQTSQIHCDFHQLVNAHMLIMGKTGMGKTTFLRRAIQQISRFSPAPRIHIMDVHGDIDLKEASSIRFSESTEYGLNPFVVSSDQHFGGVRKRVQDFITTINGRQPIGSRQEAVMRQLITDLYAANGFFADNYKSWVLEDGYAERRILTRATPEIRKEYEVLWAHAAFLNGLFSEAITAISKISVYAEDVRFEWHPGTESLYEWLRRNNLKRYHIRWTAKEDRSMIYILAGKAINTQQAEILAQGEKAIYKTLLAALHDQTDFANPLAKINDQVKYKIMERDEWSHAGRYGKPLAGMHLEPWLIDAMRHLVNKKRWAPNEDNGRIWCGQDGVFLVWPLAASDMQYQLKESECPFAPQYPGDFSGNYVGRWDY